MTKIRYVTGDILTVQSGVIVHGCNALGVMGAGVAKQIAKRYPSVYKDYREYCKKSVPEEILGDALMVKVSDELIILNAITQLTYGSILETRYVSYDAIDRVFDSIASIYDSCTHIHMPKIGAGLGGGNWGVITEIIQHRLSTFDNVFCWTLD